MRKARSVAAGIGVVPWLESMPERPLARWARSLFAIYDIDDMVRLDLPWWNFAAINRVDSFLRSRPGARVFEYGSGASTVWLGRRAADVFSVEHDAGWAPVVREQLAAMPGVRQRIDHRLVPPDEPRIDDPAYASTKPGWREHSFRRYVHAIDDADGLFDVIVIDGRARPACLDHAAPRLARDGIIVFDNSRRATYQAAIARSGLRTQEYAGLTACLPYPDATTLLQR
ncbi:class I SAM-dependent methyltransferase [Sphingosinicellaceae bacterium]|nr:class I SAM-dependent methyltransferase [Sphingosinicellaceae bacterium]